MEAGARARRAPVGVAWIQTVWLTTSDYVALTKPRVISLLLGGFSPNPRACSDSWMIRLADRPGSRN